jgi:glutamine amidotransferase
VLAAERAGLDAEVRVTADPDYVSRADRIVLPGQGAFADCARGLEAVAGMRQAIERATNAGAPFLGICVGMQLMARIGREHGDHEGLGWIDGEVVRLVPDDPALKIPHMGWNALEILRPHRLLDGIESGAHAYFVHAYHLLPDRAEDLVARTQHGGPVSALIVSANMAGTQFHPEKSQALGLQLITNFLRWQP